MKLKKLLIIASVLTIAGCGEVPVKESTSDGQQVTVNNQTLKGEIICPHDSDSDTPIQCADCRLCDGLGRHKNGKNIAVVVHGSAGVINAFNRIEVAMI